MNLLIIKRLIAAARGLPGILYAGAFAVVFIGAGIAAIYYTGAHAGAAKVVRIARRDSTAHAVVHRDSAIARTDRSTARADSAKHAADAGRVRVRHQVAHANALRHDSATIAALDSASAPVKVLVDSLGSAVDSLSAQVTRDSVESAHSAAARDSAAAERATHLAVDTARVHEALDPTPDDGVSALEVAKDVSLVAVILGTLAAIWSLFHR